MTYTQKFAKLAKIAVFAMVATLPAFAANTGIMVASKKYNDTQFAPVKTRIDNVTTSLNSVVSNTLSQAGTVNTLLTSKQDRPADGSCPTYRQCLLIKGTDNKPHWFTIIDPLYDLLKPIIAQNISAANANITSDSGYTQLEYLQSSGTQYINTGVSGLNSGDWEIYVKWSMTNTSQNTYAYVVGAYQGETYNSYRIIVNQNSAINYYVSGNSKAGGGSVQVNNLAAGAVHTGIIRNGSVVVDGVTYVTPTKGTAIPAANTIGLFRHGNGGQIIKGRIYESWAMKNGEYKYHMIPAQRNSDGAYGMYDKVSGTFFTNAGSGTFTAGAVVANTDVPGSSWSVELTGTEGTNVRAGTINGTSVCNTVSGTANVAATSANLSSSGWTTSGTNCWCSITSVTMDEGDGLRDNPTWVFNATNSSCVSQCPGLCATSISNGSNGAFRTAISGVK